MSGDDGRHLSAQVLSDLLDGCLHPDAKAGARAHLESCGACREEYRRLQRAVELLRRLPPLEPPPALESRIKETLRQRTAGHRSRRALGGPWASLLAAAAGAVVVLGGSVLLLQRFPPLRTALLQPGSPVEVAQPPAAAPPAPPVPGPAAPHGLQLPAGPRSGTSPGGMDEGKYRDPAAGERRSAPPPASPPPTEVKPAFRREEGVPSGEIPRGDAAPPLTGGFPLLPPAETSPPADLAAAPGEERPAPDALLLPPAAGEGTPLSPAKAQPAPSPPSFAAAAAEAVATTATPPARVPESAPRIGEAAGGASRDSSLREMADARPLRSAGDGTAAGRIAPGLTSSSGNDALLPPSRGEKAAARSPVAPRPATPSSPAVSFLVPRGYGAEDVLERLVVKAGGRILAVRRGDDAPGPGGEPGADRIGVTALVVTLPPGRAVPFLEEVVRTTPLVRRTEEGGTAAGAEGDGLTLEIRLLPAD